MKRTIYATLALLLAGCAPRGEQPDPSQLLIFAGIAPLAGIVESLTEGNDEVEVVTLVDAGQSPHSYEPTAKQLARLGAADLLVLTGLAFEEALARKIGPLHPHLTLVRADAGIAKRAMPHEHGPDCEHDATARDPHVWLDLENLKTISTTLLEALVAADPDHAALYRANHEQLVLRLAERHARIAQELAPHAGARFYVYHPSFGYFADRHHLTQVPIELDGKSPSPRQLARLIEQARSDGISLLFVQKRFPIDAARAIAEAIGGEVVRVDPLAADVAATLQQIADGVARTQQP